MRLIATALALALVIQYALTRRKVAELRRANTTLTRERDALLRYALRQNQKQFLARLREDVGT